MKEESQHPSIDPQLEARIVALVLGEASDFERDELNRLIDQRPELATLKEQMQSVHGLLRDVGAGESVADDEQWKLSAEKRSAVVAVISGEAQEQPAKQVVIKSPQQQASVNRNLIRNIAKIAAVFLAAVTLAGLTMPAIMMSRRASSVGNTRQLGLAVHNYHDTWAFTDEAASSSTRRWGTDKTVEFDYKKNSKSALSDIRGSLNADAILPDANYLTDDVQYFPAVPESKVSVETGTPRPGSAREKLNRPAVVNRSRQTANPVEFPAVGGEGEDGAASQRDGDGDGSADSPAADPLPADSPTKPESSKLSVPKFADRGRERNGDEPPQPEQVKVIVSDGGTVRLGGIQQRLDVNVEDEMRSVTSSITAEPDAAEKEEQDLPDLSLSIPDSPAGGKGYESRTLGFAVVEFPGDSENAQAPVARVTAGGQMGSGLGGMGGGMGGGGMGGGGMGGGGMGGGGGAIPANRKSREITADGNPQSADGREVAASPSPLFAGIADLQEIVQQVPEDDAGAGVTIGFDGISGLPTPDLDVSLGNQGFGTKTPLNASGPVTKDTELYNNFQTARVAKAKPSHAIEPLAAREELKQKSESVELNRRDGQAGNNGTLDRQAIPITGTAIGQPAAALKGAQTKQHGGWRYGERAKSALGEIDALNETYKFTPPNESRDHGREYGSRPDARQLKTQSTTKPQRDQVAINGQNHWEDYIPPMVKDLSDSIKKPPVKKWVAPAGLNEVSAEQEAFSTFSLHVSDVSFKLAQAALARGQWPEAAKVRIEEFVNAFDYGDPLPCRGEKVACQVEQSIHPFLQQRNLLRVSMRTAAAGRASNTPLRLTFLLDNSGSMERIDRQQLVRRAFALLAQQLKPIDQVTLISFARQPRLLADKVSGAQSRQLVQLIEDLPSEGGTNIEAALQLAFEKAREQWVDNAQNRIILLTDGAVNLGDANPQSLSRMITAMRDAGVAFDAAGISADGLNDEVLEALTRKGDGRYYLLDTLESADDGFASQIAGALRPSAKNVKVQIEFNPKRVDRYKLLGFEKHRLKKEDFRNDKVDAAEMAAAESGVAMYQFEAKPDGEGDVGTVFVRFRDLSSGQMVEHSWPIPYEADAPRADQAAPSLRIATCAALLASKLRGEPLGETVDLKTLSNLLSGLPDQDRSAKRVGQLELMIQQARQVSGK